MKLTLEQQNRAFYTSQPLKLINEQQHSVAQLFISQAYSENGMNEDSLEIIDKAIGLYPDEAALKWLKAVQLQFLSRFRESDELLETSKVVELKQFDSLVNG